MIVTRRAHERGHAEHGWLRAFHTFSFADYHDPVWMGFGALRVLNHDRIEPGRGFGEHGVGAASKSTSTSAVPQVGCCTSTEALISSPN
jgi:hypothetical protein